MPLGLYLEHLNDCSVFSLFVHTCTVAPTGAASAAGAAGGSFLARALSDKTLKSWGAPVTHACLLVCCALHGPGGNMFEPGSFSLASRLLNLGYKVRAPACSMRTCQSVPGALYFSLNVAVLQSKDFALSCTLCLFPLGPAYCHERQACAFI
eukprot:1160545-Pelagomonas_calceolata.AAC.10